jgi:hypothetical protein
MQPRKRKSRYLGMTAGQVTILAVTAGLIGLMLVFGLVLVLSPSESELVATANQQSASLPTPNVTPATPRFPPTWTPTPTPTVTPTRTPPPGATSTRTPRPPIGRPQLAAWEKLTSYRVKLNLRMGAGSTGQSMLLKIDYAWVKEPEAAHILMSIDGTGLPAEAAALNIESYQVGNTTWSRMGGDWQKTTSQSSPSMQDSWNDVEKLLRDLQPAGEEVINGIRCQHYILDENLNNSGELSSAPANIQAKGDMWIAAEADLPPVPVRVRIQLRAADMLALLPADVVPSGQSSQPIDMAYDLELDMTDINRPITIKPPAGVE